MYIFYNFPLTKALKIGTQKVKKIPKGTQFLKWGHKVHSRPTSSCILATKFPSMVERRWPTWKGLAMFGELNSTTIFFLSSSNKALLLHFVGLCDLQRQRNYIPFSSLGNHWFPLHWLPTNLFCVVVKTSEIKEGELSLKQDIVPNCSMLITWNRPRKSLERGTLLRCNLLQPKVEISASGNIGDIM